MCYDSYVQLPEGIYTSGEPGTQTLNRQQAAAHWPGTWADGTIITDSAEGNWTLEGAGHNVLQCAATAIFICGLGIQFASVF